jgi:hypothetical protein
MQTRVGLPPTFTVEQAKPGGQARDAEQGVLHTEDATWTGCTRQSP